VAKELKVLSRGVPVAVSDRFSFVEVRIGFVVDTVVDNGTAFCPFISVFPSVFLCVFFRAFYN
jgi:hypothetical protein